MSFFPESTEKLEDTEQVVDLASFANKWYNPGSLAKRIMWIFFSSLFFRHSIPLPQIFKHTLLKMFGARLGNGVLIKPSVNIKYPWYLEIGNHCWIGEHVWIDNLCNVVLGDNVCLSQGSMLLTGNHNYKSREFDLLTGEIILEQGVWIGAHAIVCPNVTCRSHSILTVNSVATTDLEKYTIYQGNPAVAIRKRVIK